MRTKTQDEFIQLLRFEMKGDALPEGFAVSDEEALIRLAEHHDLTHMVYDALTKNGLQCVSNVPMQRYYAAIWRCEQMDHELERLSALFAENGIDYVPLKGAVMRGMYPERWMRTSADIDILIRPEDMEKTGKLLVEKLSYKAENASLMDSHHDNFYSPVNKVHLELHKRLFDILNEKKPYYNAFQDIWEKAVPSPDGYGHRYCFKNDLFLLYHLAHIEKHASEAGGIAVRGLIDLWLINRASGSDNTTTEKLKENGLDVFAQRMSSLADAWMNDGPVDNEDLEQYIFEGYLYGSVDRKVAIGTQSKSRSNYLLKRIFVPYDLLKSLYPVIQKHPILTPVFEVVRWFERLTSKNTRARGARELQALKQIETAGEEHQTLAELRRYLGLAK